MLKEVSESSMFVAIFVILQNKCLFSFASGNGITFINFNSRRRLQGFYGRK
jgi:hypothetical protein